MRIGIDTSTISKNKAGVGYFTYSLTKALIENNPDNQYILYTNDYKNLSEFEIYENVEIVEFKSEKPGFNWIRQSAKHANKNTDIFISTANFTFGILCRNCVQIVHDLAPIKYPKFFPSKGVFMYKLLLNLALKRVKAVAVPLESIRDEVIEYYPKIKERIYVIGEGLHVWGASDLSSEKILEVKRKYSLPDKYFLTIGTLEPRKNHKNIIKAFNEFIKNTSYTDKNTYEDQDSQFYYVIAGKKGWFYDEIFSEVKKLKLEKKIIFLSYVPEEDLAAVYANSTVFVFCSFYEGFGLPLLEAASRKLPIVCSDIPQFREIFKNMDSGTKNVVNFVDPEDPENILNGLKMAVEQKSVDYNDVLFKYSWENTAKNLNDILQTPKI